MQFGRDPAAAAAVSFLSPFILLCHLHNFSCNAEGQIKLHQRNISPEVLSCTVLLQTFLLSPVIVRKIQNFQHLVFRKDSTAKKPQTLTTKQKTL